MSERKPIGLSVPHRGPAKTREELEKRVTELEAMVKQLEKAIRALDRALLTGRK
jgi:exonuclease VII small subunit